jgi:penicillin-binding protein 1A
MLGLLAFVSFAYGMITAIGSDLGQLDPSTQHKPQLDGRIVAGDGKTVLAILRGSEARSLASSDEIPFVMKHAIVDIEDRRFFEHRGIDLRGMARAAWSDLRNKKLVEGGSTITQQFVKNTYRQNERTIARKLREAALAWQLEKHWNKDKILTAYLNTIYFGNGAYGIKQAARTYFGHGPEKLTLAEAALLAGIPKDPGRYDPVRFPRVARARRALVLRKMLEQEDITPAEARTATEAPLPDPAKVTLGSIQGKAPYFTNFVKDELVRRYGASYVYGGGIEVVTSIDLGLQKLAHDAIDKWLPDPQGPTAALVALDPRDGRVLAMVGGRNFRASQFNLATQGERQPGSAFKPFVLTAALEQGISPSSYLTSKPQYIYLGDRYWSVSNAEGDYLGPIDLRTATTYSDNTVYAQLTEFVGPPAIREVAKRLGIKSPLHEWLSIGLGGEAVNPLEMARAYAAFADNGNLVEGSQLPDEPRAVLAIRSIRNDKLKANSVVSKQEIDPNTAAMVTQLLQGVVSSGTGRRAALADRPVAGKTGTTENYGDAWFVGYTPQLAVAVWVGYPNKLVPMENLYHGDPVAGGTYPALVWKSFMESAFSYLSQRDPSGGWEPESFPEPSYPYSTTKQVVWRDGSLKLDNGYCRYGFPLVYFAGYGPDKVAQCKPNEVEVPRVIGMKLTDAQARLAQQPLESEVLYKPAEPLQRPGIVLDQIPRRGHLSSYDKVILVLAKPTAGLIPDLVGLTLPQARAKLRALNLRPELGAFVEGRPGRVVAQRPKAGGAAEQGMSVTLAVGRG